MPTGRLKEKLRALVSKTSGCLRTPNVRQIVSAILLVATVTQAYWTLFSPTPAYADQPITINLTATGGAGDIKITQTMPTLVSADPKPTTSADPKGLATNQFSFNEVTGTTYNFKVQVTTAATAANSNFFHTVVPDTIYITVYGATATITSQTSETFTTYSISTNTGAGTNDASAAGINSSNKDVPSGNTITTHGLDCESKSGKEQGWFSYIATGVLTAGVSLALPDVSIGKALCQVTSFALEAFFSIMHSVINWTMGWALQYATVSPYLNFTKPPASVVINGVDTVVKVPWAKTLYDISLNIVNYVIVLLLIFLSFANILHINVDTYGIKKAMPTLIIGVLLANFGLLIVHFVADAAEVLAYSFTGRDAGQFLYDFYMGFAGGLLSAGGTGGFVTLLGAMIVTGPAGFIVLMLFVLLCFIPVGILLVLGLLFWLRFYVVVLLAAVSPLAFMAMSLPMTESYFKQWFSNLIKWVFMAPVSLFFLWVAIRINISDASFQSLIIGSVMAYLAIKVPFGMGGAISTQFGGLLKKAGSFIGKTADKTMGDITQQTLGSRLSPMSFYQGWKSRSDEKWQEHLNKGGVEGRAINEAAGHAVAGALTLKWAKGEFRKNIREGYKTEKARGNDILQGEMKKKFDAKISRHDGEDADVKKEFDAAIEAKNFDAASMHLADMGSRGTAKMADMEEFRDAFIGTKNEDAAKMAEALIVGYARNADTSAEPITSTMKTANGKVTRLDEGEIMKGIEKETLRLATNKGTIKARSQMKVIYKNNFVDENNQEIRPGSAGWKAKHDAMINALKQVSKDVFVDSPELQKIVENGNIQLKFGDQEYQAIDDHHAKTAVHDLVHSQGRGSVYPQNGAPNDTHYRQAEAISNPANWDKLIRVFKEQSQKIEKGLADRGHTGAVSFSEGDQNITVNNTAKERAMNSGDLDIQGLIHQSESLKRTWDELKDTKQKFENRQLPGQVETFNRLSAHESKTI